MAKASSAEETHTHVPASFTKTESAAGRSFAGVTDRQSQHRPQEPAGTYLCCTRETSFTRKVKQARGCSCARLLTAGKGSRGLSTEAAPGHAQTKRARAASCPCPAKLPRCLPGACLRNQKRRNSNKCAPVLSQPCAPVPSPVRPGPVPASVRPVPAPVRPFSSPAPPFEPHCPACLYLRALLSSLRALVLLTALGSWKVSRPSPSPTTGIIQARRTSSFCSLQIFQASFLHPEGYLR
ncbi:uncharacterized protein LOC123374052 [Mauremys mutica]|uniref:uncharacterized protein LOC123374052 n=1 Tax=Mauremys mutica TaxID=74926 RepID=UPI001D16C36A|nr:uncharacterized protein LOC123374052 [Mauremys mutica]